MMASYSDDKVLCNDSLMASDCDGTAYAKSGPFVVMTTLVEFVTSVSIVLPANFIATAILQHPQFPLLVYGQCDIV